LFLQRERIQAAKDLMEAKRTLEENQRKRFVPYACHDDISNSKLLIGEVIFLFTAA
jgi:hypothetical protein